MAIQWGKKLGGLLVIAVMVTSLVMLPFTAVKGAENSVYNFYDDFETGEIINTAPTKWVRRSLDEYGQLIYLGTGNNITIGEETNPATQEKNQFMRLAKATTTGSPLAYINDGLVNIPLRSQERAPGTSIVVEAKIRPGTPDAHWNMLRLNYPTIISSADHGNTGVLFMTHNTQYPWSSSSAVKGMAFLDAGNSTQLSNYVSVPDAALESRWYSYRAIIDPDNDQISHYIDGAPAALDKSFAATEFASAEFISNIAFNMKWLASTVAGSMDVDEVKLYRIYGRPTARLIAGNDNTIPSVASEIAVTFTLPMDEATLNSATISLFTSGDEVACTNRRYDAASKTYYLSPDQPMIAEQGYSLELSDEIYALNTEEFKANGKLTGIRSFAFTALRPINITTLSDIKVDGVTIDGFQPTKEEYVLDIPYSESMVIPDITAAATDTNASVEITIPEQVKNGVFYIDVTAEDGYTTLQYKIILNVLATPVASNVAISKKGNNMLQGKYEYSHPMNVVEGKSICKWYIGGKVAGEGTSYIYNGAGRQTITFEVTPVASVAPYEGMSVSAAITIGNAEPSGSFGGGSRGGGVMTMPSVPTPTLSPAPVAKESAPSHSGHWASEAVAFVTMRGIMEADEEGGFEMDEMVTRAELTKYIILALGIEPVVYQDEFEDVASEDGYSALLQAAVNHGIISKDTHFNPERLVSREEMCKIISIGIEAVQGQEMPVGANLERFSDASDIQSWALQYAEKIAHSGIMRGISENEFCPLGTVTRAQAAVAIQRMASYIEGEGNI